MRLFVWLLLLCFFRQLNAAAQKPLRIVCVGGSDTYGENVANRSKNAYPFQLQQLLGTNYTVKNLGWAHATVIDEAPESYKQLALYKELLRTGADIFILHFGTGESALLHKFGTSRFEKAYDDLIHSLKRSHPQARIILLKSPPVFVTDTTLAHAENIQREINPAIERLAFNHSIELVDLYAAFVDRSDLFPDGIQMSSLGASVLAKKLYDIVRLPDNKSLFSTAEIPAVKGTTSFYGYEEIDFTFKGRDGRIVKPKRVAKNNPWIWRARFWGHEPQTDIALLERGFHLVYCDAAEWYGNPEAIQLWDSFYQLMQELELSPKPVLEAMSRGAVYAYNWALAHPERIAAIYADAPVLDLKSWPGGKGKGPGSADDWEIFKKDYDLTDSAARLFSQSPLDRTNEIIRTSYPILHVVGDADEVVPLEENTAPFEAQLVKGNRQITVIHKPGIKHHPHSLPNPTAIVDFILRATGHKTNFANLPAPGAEYRSGAGWKEGADWWQQQEDINTLLSATKKLNILFLGNSITQGIGGERRNVTYKPGKRIFDSVFSGYKYISAGISGDRTQQILWRLQHSPLKQVPVKWIVLTIGVNNFADDEPSEIVAGIQTALQWLHKNKRGTKIIVTGPLPAGMNSTHPFRNKYEAVHRLLKEQNHYGSMYLPLGGTFILADGAMDPELYSTDGIHLLENGYAKWAQALKAAIDKHVW